MTPHASKKTELAGDILARESLGKNAHRPQHNRAAKALPNQVFILRHDFARSIGLE